MLVGWCRLRVGGPRGGGQGGAGSVWAVGFGSVGHSGPGVWLGSWALRVLVGCGRGGAGPVWCPAVLNTRARASALAVSAVCQMWGQAGAWCGPPGWRWGACVLWLCGGGSGRRGGQTRWWLAPLGPARIFSSPAALERVERVRYLRRSVFKKLLLPRRPPKGGRRGRKGGGI